MQPGMAQNTEFPTGVGVRAIRSMAAAGALRLDDLTQFTETEIADLDDVEPGTIGILKDALAERGLSFASGATTDGGSR